MQQKVSSQLCQNRIPGLDLNMTVESVLDALTTSFFPSGKGYGVLPIAQNATSHVRETFNAYGSIDNIDKKRCSIALPHLLLCNLTFNRLAPKRSEKFLDQPIPGV